MAQTAGIIAGKIVKLMTNTVAIDDQLDCSFTLSQDTTEITTKQSTANFKEYMTDYKGGTANANGFVSFDAAEGLTQFIADLKSGSAVALLFTTTIAGNATFATSAFPTNVNVTFPRVGAVAFTFDWIFTGEFTESTTSA